MSDTSHLKSVSHSCAACGLEIKTTHGHCPRCLFKSLFAAHDSREPLETSVIGDSLETSSSEQPLTRDFGYFRILEEIGHGGMGTVYVAEQLRPVRRKVAVKVIKLGMDTKEIIGRFEAERQALAMMNHPNIARMFEAGSTDRGRPYFVMELIRGLPLTEHCRIYNMTVEERVRLLQQICKAAHHAHEKGIIHRDLNPKNILVSIMDGHPVPKIIDFGIAKALTHPLTNTTVHTQTNQWIGTPGYTSPEQVLDVNAEVDRRADIYSLGIMLYSLLIGRPPLDSNLLKRLGWRNGRQLLATLAIAPPSKIAKSLSKDAFATLMVERQTESSHFFRQLAKGLDHITLKALERNPAKRYQTAQDMAEDIERWLNGENVEARPLRQRCLLHTKAIFLAVLLSISIMVFMLSRSEDESRIYQNSLGMKFLPLPGTNNILLSVWETRVEDFASFADANRDIGGNIVSLLSPENDEVKPRYWGNTAFRWDMPGFSQSEVHPVVGVSYNEADSFCKWLTEMEANDLPSGSLYRLPTVKEWTIAALDQGKVPWQGGWSTLKNLEPFTNLAGEEIRSDRHWPTVFKHISKYHDGWIRTSPVDAFPPNYLGFCGTIGNVSEWCRKSADQVLAPRCGGSWSTAFSNDIVYAQPAEFKPIDYRRSDIGFRVVLELGSD